jgi:hypothetical protein
MSGESEGGNFATAGDEEFDPKDAAAVLTRATRRARRQFDASPPLLGLVRAGLVLLAYGTVWLNVRGQHPYDGPKAWTVTVLFCSVVLALRVSRLVYQLATEGVSGRSGRPWWPETVAVAAALAAVFAFMGALAQTDTARAVVYGVYPAAVPLIAVGGTVAGFLAARADWPGFGAALAAVGVGAGAAFAGPAGSWGIAGLGLCAALLGHTTAAVWLRYTRAAR